jgi:hypothetical protein
MDEAADMDLKKAKKLLTAKGFVQDLKFSCQPTYKMLNLSCIFK